ncbi:unnamed protein product [Bursaphelenchus xylophilus]|uniref:(pine wood nematode) hypothetical protein n=1 Tax=Bursaphelenchus xylophilus TaxID=6326 RepID=A0A811L3V7_BURXY|nr:unnamed protein product [Bursaphelenchus xylophilus]CAG9108843.1 unnamed protein product [Bursaphelenchus xylophilus]
MLRYDRNPNVLASLRSMRTEVDRAGRGGNDVRSQMASEAKLILERAEREINKIQKRRTEALMNGDTINAERLARRINQIYSAAVREARVDAVRNERTRRPRSYDQLDTMERLPQTEGRSFRRRPRIVTPPRDYYKEYARDRNEAQTSYTRFRSPWRLPSPPEKQQRDRFRRTKSQRNNQRRSQSSGSERLKYTSNSEAAVKHMKRNKRLKDVKLPKTADVIKQIPMTGQSQLHPIPEPGETNICPQCYERNDAFAVEANLKQHWLYHCPVLTKCDFCDQVLHVAELNNHHINLCQFVNKTMLPCPLCGLAQYGGESNHPRCPKTHPEPGAAWCPLCSKKVESLTSPESWRNHLIGNCLNNPRIKSRWNGKTAPTQGASLLTGLQLNTEFDSVPINEPQQNMAPVPMAPPAVGGMPLGNGDINGPITGAPSQFGQLPPLNANQGFGIAQNPQQPTNGQNLRSAYRKLQQERKQDYEKQQEREAAEEEEKEEEDH